MRLKEGSSPIDDKDWRRRANSVLLSPSPNRHYYPDAAPWFFSRGSGQWLCDRNGHRYLDLLMARGTSVLGYAHPDVVDAAHKHAARGFLTSLRHTAEVELAELIASRLPSVDKVLFAKNGSDVCTFAVRAARAHTGRDAVLTSGFHGFGDTFVAREFAGRGFPHSDRDPVVPFVVNDHAEFTRLADAHRSDLAAIILDPMNRNVARRDFLELLREVAQSTGAVLIFDEVVTGFRVSLGGAQEQLGVRPDLTCLGKVLGNGYPISALAGRGDVLDALKRTSFSSTYQTDSMGFVIALACLRRIIADDVPARLERTGEHLRSTFEEAAVQHGVAASAVGPPSRLEFVFGETNGHSRELAESTFLDALASVGVLPTLASFVSSAMGDGELEVASSAFHSALSAVSQSCS